MKVLTTISNTVVKNGTKGIKDVTEGGHGPHSTVLYVFLYVSRLETDENSVEMFRDPVQREVTKIPCKLRTFYEPHLTKTYR